MARFKSIKLVCDCKSQVKIFSGSFTIPLSLRFNPGGLFNYKFVGEDQGNKE